MLQSLEEDEFYYDAFRQALFDNLDLQNKSNDKLIKICNFIFDMKIDNAIKQYIDDVASNELDIIEDNTRTLNMDIWIKKDSSDDS